MSMFRNFLTQQVPRLLQPLGGIPPIRRLVSRVVIKVLAGSTSPRPRALSMLADWTSWQSLTDRSFSGRHLPPATPEQLAGLPPEQEVAALFRRDGATRPSTDTSVLFMFFAQWFTDSFLRTDHRDYRKNTSNHEIDLCQIYGLTDAQTRLLRSGVGGRLKAQEINGQSYPPCLFEPRNDPGQPLVVKPEFVGLHDADFLIGTILDGASEEHKQNVFAVGLEHGNSTIGSAMLDVVFLREHNRIADLLAAENPSWGDDRLFDTARNISIVLLLKLVVEEYIIHVSPFDFPLEMVPFVADGASWNRSNWCAVEFNLLYRWHSLVPDTMTVGGQQLGADILRNNNPLLLTEGVESILSGASSSRAGRIGLGNTPAFLVDGSPGRPSLEQRTVKLMRDARLRPYNDYRRQFGLKPLADFDRLTSDPALQQRLRTMYGSIDRLEWYVGIFAEDYPDHAMVGDLLTRMVAYDAFTQALTNPLLARNVYSAETFTALGLQIIETTSSLQELVERNVADPASVRASFSWSASPAGRGSQPEGTVTVPAQATGREAAPRSRPLRSG